MTKTKIILETKTTKGKTVQIKLNIAPSKEQGLGNFLKLAKESGKNITFTLEKSNSGEESSSEVQGTLKI